MGQLAKGIAKCLATISYVVNIKLIPYIFRVELCPPVTHYLMTITKLAQTMALVLHFKEEKRCGRNLLLLIYVLAGSDPVHFNR